MEKMFTCDNCGSTDLEALAFCEVNTQTFVDWSQAGDADECYCNDCQEWTHHSHTEVVHVRCPQCGKEMKWDNCLAVENAHCKECDVEMEIIGEIQLEAEAQNENRTI